jgi:hypothetical protein
MANSVDKSKETKSKGKKPKVSLCQDVKAETKTESLELEPILGNIKETDCLEIETSVKRSLHKRRDVTVLLKTLEQAWKNAVSEELSKEENIKTESHILQEAQTKKSNISNLEKKIFLSFGPLTSLDHRHQLELGQNIINSLPPKNTEEMIQIAEQTQTFFKNENKLNIVFLREVENICSKTDVFLTKISKIKEMPCQDKKLDNLLTKDLNILSSFLKATKKLFNG